MAPGVHRDLVTGEVLLLEERGVGERARADDEEGGLEVVLVEVVEEVRGIGRGAVVVGQAPGELVGAADDVGRAGAPAAGPPAALRVVRDGAGVSGAPAGDGGGESGDRDARVLDVLDPLQDLGGVRRGRLVERGVVRDDELGHCKFKIPH